MPGECDLDDRRLFIGHDEKTRRKPPTSPAYQAGPDLDLSTEDSRDSRGRRIVEDYAQRGAEYAPTSVPRSRRSLTGGRTHSPRVSFRVPKIYATPLNMQRHAKARPSPNSPAKRSRSTSPPEPLPHSLRPHSRRQPPGSLPQVVTEVVTGASDFSEWLRDRAHTARL